MIYQVEIEHSELYYLIRDLAEKSGWAKRLDGSFYPWLVIKPQEGRVGGNYTQYKDYPIISIREAVALLKKGPKPEPPPLTIDGRTVRFGECGISWGGVTVQTKVIDQIHERLHEDKT